MDLPRPFIRLPRRFDASRLAEEIAALPATAWMAHPSRMAGNTAVALVSQNGADNDAFDGPMAPTPHLLRCAYLQQVMASFGEVLGRSRLMRLAPGSEVALHVDFNYHWVSRVRIHIPIVTDPAVIFHCAQEQVHMPAGSCWLFNAWRRHRVSNDSAIDRVHLVIDTAGSARFWRRVQQAVDNPAQDPELLPFDADGRPPVLRTEHYNTSPVMAPAELDALVNELVAEFSAHPGNDPVLVARYQQLLDDLRHDWRSVWLQFGPARSGWPEYEALLERARNGLHPNPRALLTASNEIGVNPVIVQRILTPALDRERHEDLVRAVQGDVQGNAQA